MFSASNRRTGVTVPLAVVVLAGTFAACACVTLPAPSQAAERDQYVFRWSDLPLVTPDVPGTGGVVRTVPEDFRVTEIPTLHRARTSGVGKYGFSRFAKGFLDLITVLTLTRFRWRPQHLIGVIGLWVVVGGSLVALESLLLPSRVLSALIVPLLGVLLIAVGLVAELIVAERPLGSLYEIAERTGWCTQQKTASQLDPVAVSHDHEL